ncbi:hypothetical protein ES707_02143 [subsurface metagenome]
MIELKSMLRQVMGVGGLLAFDGRSLFPLVVQTAAMVAMEAAFSSSQIGV